MEGKYGGTKSSVFGSTKHSGSAPKTRAETFSDSWWRHNSKAWHRWPNHWLCDETRRNKGLGQANFTHAGIEGDDGAARGIHPDGHDVRRGHPRLLHRGTHGVSESVPPVVGILPAEGRPRKVTRENERTLELNAARHVDECTYSANIAEHWASMCGTTHDRSSQHGRVDTRVKTRWAQRAIFYTAT